MLGEAACYPFPMSVVTHGSEAKAVSEVVQYGTRLMQALFFYWGQGEEGIVMR